MEQNTVQNNQKLKHRMPLPKKHKSLVIIASVFLSIGVIVALVYSYFNFIYNTPPRGIYAEINGQKITTNEFNDIYNAYLKFDQSNSKDPNSVDKKQVERRAADEVLLRLALQSEATKKNIQICNTTVLDKQLADRYEAAGSRQKYYNNLNQL